MNRTISVITPVFKPLPAHLLQAYESLSEQSMPSGWQWQWVVHEDGPTHRARDILPADDRIVFSRARHGGVAIARNLALARADGELVKNLDQDDVLMPGTLSRDISNIQKPHHVRWTTSRVLDLMPDGSTIGFDDDPEPGPLRPPFVFEHWKSHRYRLPVHPTTICIARSLAVALGGWMASPGSDDTGLLIAASLVSTGYFESDVGLLYRKWPGQETAQASHTEPTEWRLRMKLIEERGEAIQALRWAGSNVSADLAR
jgi:glycosyltransferase involved in cell wall biosynthesis